MTGRTSQDSPIQQLCDISAKCLAVHNQLQAVIAFKSSKRGEGGSGKISHSQPPWNAAVAFAIMGLHRLARKTEDDFRLRADLPVRSRGGSDKNTQRALEASGKLAEKASDAAVLDAVRELDRWMSRAKITLGELEFPQRLPRLPGKKEPACPWCKFRTLRMFPLRGFIVCITPDCKDEEGRKPRATMEYSEFTGTWEMCWQDSILGVPTEEAA